LVKMWSRTDALEIVGEITKVDIWFGTGEVGKIRPAKGVEYQCIRGG